MPTRTDLDVAREALRAISNARADDYQMWLHVGMAAKASGLSFADWSAWSQHSPKFDHKDAVKKWDSFKGTGFTLGTLVHMATEDGTRIDTRTDTPRLPKGETIGWDTPIGPKPKVILSVEETATPLPTDLTHLDADEMMWTYLDALYRPADLVSTVTECTPGRTTDKWNPVGHGNPAMPADEMIAKLKKTEKVSSVLPKLNAKAGAWCRINPVDGNGIKDENITDYRHVLVESDDMPVEQQFAIYQKLNLPIAAVVTSGRASLHAIVKVTAGQDLELYKRRVDHLYSLLAENGFKIDKANRNPSRLSRIPGVQRGEGKQQLLATDIGATSYEDWIEYLEGLAQDNLPAVVHVTPDHIENPPPLRPELIASVLRCGHTLLLSGPSKAGKSYNLIQLAIAISAGGSWMGHPILNPGPVLAVNLEVDENSYLNRVSRTAKRMKADGQIKEYPTSLDVWTLRGHAVELGKLVPIMCRRLNGRPHSAIILDPIYKLMEGDENSNSDMARFWRHFDKLARETGCAIIIAHHFSKGTQGGKASIDRSSGAGTFGRAPDGCITLSPLDIGENVLPKGQFAFQVDYNLREFPPRDFDQVVYDNPIHRKVEMDESSFSDAKVTGTPGRPKKWTKAVILEAADRAKAGCLLSGKPLDLTAIRDVLGNSRQLKTSVIREWILDDNPHYEFAPNSTELVVPKCRPSDPENNQVAGQEKVPF